MGSATPHPNSNHRSIASRSSAVRSQIVAVILRRRPTRRQKKKRQMLTMMDFALANGLLPSPLRSPLSLLVGAGRKCYSRGVGGGNQRFFGRGIWDLQHARYLFAPFFLYRSTYMSPFSSPGRNRESVLG